MQVWKKVKVRLDDKLCEAMAMFDSRSSFTIMSYDALNELFGEVRIRRLEKAREAVLVNGQRVTIDAFLDSQIVIDDYMIEERIYLSKDVVGRAVVKGEEVLLPNLIIGSPTMEAWGIELDLKRGDVIIRGASFIL